MIALQGHHEEELACAYRIKIGSTKFLVILLSILSARDLWAF